MNSETQNMEDKELVLRAKKDINAFDELYKKYFPLINRFIYHKVSEEEVRRDIVSNVFFKALKNIYKFQYLTKGAFSGWLYRIAINEVTDYYRKNGRTKRLVEDVKLNQDSPLSEEIEINYENLRIAIKKLNEKEQNVIILRYFEKMSNLEIAEILGKKEGAVKVQVHRAMQKLKTIITELEGRNDG
ncbi:sigma-70 family RNA polymerase sigma factor [bacterium]|nr:sigma-70 family RNA polymerase sigma factor [bacterium]